MPDELTRSICTPLTQKELGADFELLKALRFGLLPLAVTGNDPKLFLDSYIQTYLREEVLQEGLTRNLSAFTHFLQTASFSQGQVLNISEVTRECHLNRKSRQT